MSDEPQYIFDLYGEDSKNPGTFAANCLLARKLAEKDVKFIQLYHRGWDHHGDLKKYMGICCGHTDKPTWALVEDLKQRDTSKALRDLEAKCAEAEARADRAEAALLENFDESESDAGDTLQEWRERCLRAEDAYASTQNLRDKLDAQERITA